jgi:hypothetical protein
MPSLAARVCSMKLTSALWFRPVCGGFHNFIRFNCAPFFASWRRHRVLTVTCLDACRFAAYIRHYPGICLEGQRKNHKIFSHNSFPQTEIETRTSRIASRIATHSTMTYSIFFSHGVRLSPLGTAAYCTSPGWQMMSVKQSVEWRLAGETEVLGEYLPQRHFVHHKSHMNWPGSKKGYRGGKPVANGLSYDMAPTYGIRKIRNVIFMSHTQFTEKKCKALI